LRKKISCKKLGNGDKILPNNEVLETFEKEYFFSLNIRFAVKRNFRKLLLRFILGLISSTNPLGIFEQTE